MHHLHDTGFTCFPELLPNACANACVETMQALLLLMANLALPSLSRATNKMRATRLLSQVEFALLV